MGVLARCKKGLSLVSGRPQPLTSLPDSHLPQSGGFMDMFGMMNDMIGNMVCLASYPSLPLISAVASLGAGGHCAGEEASLG